MNHAAAIAVAMMLAGERPTPKRAPWVKEERQVRKFQAKTKNAHHLIERAKTKRARKAIRNLKNRGW